MSFRDRLRRLRRDGDESGSTQSKSGSAESANPSGGEVVARGRKVGEPADLESFAGPLGLGQARVATFAVDSIHGEFALNEVRAASMEDLVLLTGDQSLAEIELEGAVYLDTETTGLSGGAGTYVFMIGLGRFNETEEGPRFEVWQGFLPGPEGEAMLLAECARRVSDSSGVVSFFGKSFDRHRLEDKMRLCKVEPPFEDRPHLDLYHPCRRLYRGAYGDGRLKTMEAELCGLRRSDDLPGSEAPEAWFDYLGQRPHRLEGVFRHNLDDVLSLVTLAAHLGRSRSETRRDGSELGGDPRTRALGIARSLSARGDRPSAIGWMEQALARGAEPVRSIQRERADLLRLSGQYPKAIEAYRSLVGGVPDRESVPSLLELAKLLEHQSSDFAGALECCLCAESLIDHLHTGPEYARLARDMRKRLARLRSKLA